MKKYKVKPFNGSAKQRIYKLGIRETDIVILKANEEISSEIVNKFTPYARGILFEAIEEKQAIQTKKTK